MINDTGLGIGAAVSGGLQGLLEAYKLKMAQDMEEAKLRQSGYNAAAKIMASVAAQTKPAGAREETINGIRYLVRAGARGQEVWTPVINQKGSASQADSAQGNIASITQAPEYLNALKKVPFGNAGIRASQMTGIGSLLGLFSPAIAEAREKRKAFITPYLSAGGGKALTEGEKKIFEGRVNESSLIGKGTSTQGIQDLTSEIAGKTRSAIDTNAMGPATTDLRSALDAAMARARKGGALPGGDTGGWEQTIYNGQPARRRRTADGKSWEVEVDE